MMKRHLFGLGLFVGAMAAIMLSSDVLNAQGKNKDNDKEEQQLRKQIANLQQDIKQGTALVNNLKQELREREQVINKLQAALKNEKKDDKSDDKALNQAKKDLAEAIATIREKDAALATFKKTDAKEDATAAKTIDELRKQVKDLEGMKGAPYVHTVILKMKPDATVDDIKALTDDIPTALGKIPSVRGLWYGKRAKDASPDFAETDFEITLVLLFDNFDGLKRYLDHPLHKSFLDKHLKKLETPKVYDVLKP